ncbi:MAG: hypothetical protein NZ872_02000 [Archaeoglobaceae archaeon]|nr:hypothetical protein [Archaeoglobaceae archaeon]MDW8127971.1 hypothetical protein [Archaeoglobaceae archaeon]
MDVELKKAIVPVLFGILAGFFSFLVTQDLRQRDAFGIIILVLFIYIQKFVFPKLNVKLQPKDWFGLSFITLASWYIAWTFLLNL